MLKVFDNVRAGIEKPNAISNAVISRRTSKMNLNSCKQICPDDMFTVGIQHLQGDNIECKFLLSARNDGSIILHKVKNTTSSMNYQCESLWKCGKHDRNGHRYSVECIRWFPTDNGIFVSAGVDKKLKIWDTSRLQCVETLSFNGKIYNFDLSPARTRNCTVAACCSGGVVSVFELQSGTNVHTLKQHAGDVLTCNWSPFEEHILCTGAVDNKVLLWDVRSSKNCLMSLNRCYTIETTCEKPCQNNFTAHTGAVNAVKFVRGGLKLISCGTDNFIRLWDTLTGKNELVYYEMFSSGSKRSIHIDISRDAFPEFVYVPSRDTINVYNVESGKLITSLKGHFNNVNCCFYDRFMHELYSGCIDGLILSWCDDKIEEIAFNETWK